MYSVLVDFCESEIVRLRGRDKGTYELVLISDLGEAHSKRVIKLCNKYGILKQSTPGYTPQVNAYVERWFRTIGEMSRCQLGQFDMDEEYWEDARSHGSWLYNRVPPAKLIDGEP